MQKYNFHFHRQTLLLFLFYSDLHVCTFMYMYTERYEAVQKAITSLNRLPAMATGYDPVDTPSLQLGVLNLKLINWRD